MLEVEPIGQRGHATFFTSRTFSVYNGRVMQSVDCMCVFVCVRIFM